MLERKRIKKFGLRFEHSELYLLAASERQNSVRILHLSNRAVNALQVKGIRSIGQLIKRARKEIPDLRGATCRSEVLRALNALSQSIERDGSVDWIKYARTRKFLVLPGMASIAGDPEHFLFLFPKLAKVAVESKYGRPEAYVLEQYLLAESSRRLPLAEIGQSMGYGRQRASLSKARAVRLLRNAMIDDNYSGCSFRFRPAFVAPLRRLVEALDDHLITYAKWQRLAFDALGIMPERLRHIEDLILAIAGYRVIDSNVRQFHPIVAQQSRSTAPIWAAIGCIERILRREFAKGVSRKQLVLELRAKVSKRFTSSEMTTLLNSIPGAVHEAGKYWYQIGIEKPARMVDQLERILRENGSAMYLRDLTAKIRELKGRAGSVRSAAHVQRALSLDERFKPIGRIGLWTLTEWNQETGTIAEVAEKFLRQSSGPLTEAKLYELISSRRPVNISSLRSSLRDSGKFCRVAPLTWRLNSELGS